MTDDDNYDSLEQSERARTYFQKYGSAVITGILAAVAILWGYRGWEASRTRELFQAQDAYVEFSKVLESKDEKKITQMGAQMRLSHTGTTYASLASMSEAKYFIEAGKIDQAEAALRYATVNGNSPELKDLAQLRLARLLSAKGKHADAIQALNSVTNKGFKGEMEEIRGDVLVAMNKLTEARAAYAAALTATDLAGSNRATLQQKLDNLGESKS